MKKLILITFLSLVYLYSIGQVPTGLKKGDYIKGKNLQLFEGKWQWKQGADTLILELSKQTYTLGTAGIKVDEIVGNYRYVKNGIEKYNTFKLSQDSNQTWITALDKKNETGDNHKIISMIMYDSKTKKRRQREMLMILDLNDPKKAILQQNPRHQAFDQPSVENELFFSKGFLLNKLK